MRRGGSWTEQTVVVAGREKKERALRYCTNRPRKHSLDGEGGRRGQGEVILLDGTGSLRAEFGWSSTGR